jgi:hypothetical protein
VKCIPHSAAEHAIPCGVAVVVVAEQGTVDIEQ